MTMKKYCEICEKDISYKNYSHHIKTKKHINNLLKNNDKDNDKNNDKDNNKNNQNNDDQKTIYKKKRC